jgi:alpha-2-macroglobulin
MRRRARLGIIVALCVPLLWAVARGQRRLAPVETQMTQTGSPEGLQFSLGEGREAAFEPRRIEPAPAETLDEAETARVLGRLEPLRPEEQDRQELALREGSLPAPVTGQTVHAPPFPPPEAPEAPEAPEPGPLQILRLSPEGEVPLAPSLSVTFSQPMVALTSHDDLAALAAPVSISPRVPGRWRWIGTRTLLFQPEAGRFPMATELQVEVPAGTASATAGRLPEAKRWSFATPAPKLERSFPGGGRQPLDPLLFLAFDQKVDPEAVLRTVTVRAGGGQRAVRLASAQEVKASAAVSALAEAAEAGRWLALRLQEPLAPATAVTVTVGPGTPSAEGPRTTTEPQSFGFETYSALEVAEAYCGWRRECPPLSPWTVRFTNVLDAGAFGPSMVKVEPELPAMRVDVSGDTLSIRGQSAGRTTYRVSLAPAIQDVFGQKLGKSKELRFEVGSAPPVLMSPGGPLLVADPAAGPAISVFSINHRALRVRLYSVQPGDWNAFAAYMKQSGYGRREATGTPPGREAQATSVETGGRPDELTETRIDLSPALSEGRGQVVVVVEPVPGWREVLGISKDRYEPRVVAWVQVTRIGLSAFVDSGELLGWATSLSDGTPLEGVALTVAPNGTNVPSGADGLARIALPDTSSTGPNLLVARKDGDTAILPEDLSWWRDHGGWAKSERTDAMRWFVFDDRQMYRPGERVHVKGWVRRVGADASVSAVGKSARTVRWRLRDSRGNEVLTGQAPLGPLGGFDLSLELPPTMNLGPGVLQLEAEGGTDDLSATSHGHTFQVQEFRRPEFEVSARASEGPHVVGGALTATVQASYYAGGVLPGAEVSWRVTAERGSFRPPGWDGFNFGVWRPWWFGPERPGAQGRTESFEGKTDASGEHHLRIDLLGVDPPEPTSVTAEATVMDVNRQAWSAQTIALVHPAEHYVGLRSERNFVEKGQPLHVDAILADLDGKAVAGGPIELTAVRLDWTSQGGSWRQTEEDAQSVTLQSGAEPVRASFATPQGGTYRIRATVTDARGRPNRSELTLWVTGGRPVPRRDLEQERVTLVPDRESYGPGDVAEVLVQAPFVPAEGILTLRRAGLDHVERFRLDEGTHTLRIPIAEAHQPSLRLQVDLVGAAARANAAGEVDESLPKRPAFASGTLSLPVSLSSRTLAVRAEPREAAVEPGGSTHVDVVVQDAAGRPVAGAEVALVVADEAVLALSGYEVPDPLAVFYTPAAADVRDHHLRSYVQLADPGDVLEADARPANGAPQRMMMRPAMAPAAGSIDPTDTGTGGRVMYEEGAAAAEAPIRLRTNFDALALFAPALRTGADGRVSAEVRLPDSLTRYRVFAVAVAGAQQYGKTESTLTVRLPLMVRPSPPRFLNFGDAFELPVVVQNQTDSALQVDVAVRASGVELVAGAGRRVTVPPQDRVEVRFPAETRQAGTARLQIAAVSGRWADAAELALPVWTPATTEAFATYGELDGPVVVQPLQAPSDVFLQFGGLEVSTSSTAMQALTDAVLYLAAYPFECSEQLASRVLAVAALRDVLSAFEAEGLPEPDELLAAVRRDIERLRLLQRHDGAFSFWHSGGEVWPYVSVHVAHALARAKDKGFDVPDTMLQRSRSFLKAVDRHIPSWYGPEARRSIRAYALYVRHRLGDSDAAAAAGVLDESGLDQTPLETVGWLLPVLAKDPARASTVQRLLQHLNNRATETAAAAHFVSSYGDADYLLLHSSRRTDGVLLEALIEASPQSGLIPKLVRGLLGHRKAGRWGNTQENAFVLLALDRYFKVYEAEAPDFVARVWLGERFAGEHAFRGRTTETFDVKVPMRYVAESAEAQRLILAKEGPGRMYYRLGLRYAPRSLELAPADHGFVVERTYESVDDAADVRRDSDGKWRFRAGALVRVRVTMVAPARRTHVALIDPLPAGLEALNPALAVTGSIPKDPAAQASLGRGWWWWNRVWYEHQNLRDERVEAFTSLLWEGVHEYSYVARATTPGTFVVPPPRAEEMYHPETFGRGATAIVVVE